MLEKQKLSSKMKLYMYSKNIFIKKRFFFVFGGRGTLIDIINYLKQKIKINEK